MRIGILTLPLHTNYGGILQAYALQTVLNKFGHETFVFEINMFPKIKIWKWTLPFKLLKRVFYKLLRKPTTDVFFEFRYNYIDLPRQKKHALRFRQNTESFINKYVNRVWVDSYDSIIKYHPDALIVGSDQVWRWRYRGCFHGIYNAFLGFAKDWSNTKKIAYAASFGIDEWDYNEQDTILAKELIRDLDGVSVREKSAVKMCNQFLSFDKAINVLDPTMLLDIEDYKKLFSPNTQAERGGGIFSYVIDTSDDYKEFEKKISENFRLPIHYVTSPENIGEERNVGPVESWLSAIFNSEIVITDSYHGTVFCIIFNKPFWVMGNRDGGYARFTSLLSTFGLEDRLVLEGDFNKDWKSYIDWSKVNLKRQDLKVLSLAFLKQYLK